MKKLDLQLFAEGAGGEGGGAAGASGVGGASSASEAAGTASAAEKASEELNPLRNPRSTKQRERAKRAAKQAQPRGEAPAAPATPPRQGNETKEPPMEPALTDVPGEREDRHAPPVMEDAYADETRPPRMPEPMSEREIRRTMFHLEQESAALRKLYPRLNLRELLEDPVSGRTILALRQAGVRNPVRVAYEAKYRAQIMGGLAARARREAQQMVSSSVAANRARPAENGMRQGGIQTKLDVKNLSKEQRADIRRRVRAGEKISF